MATAFPSGTPLYASLAGGWRLGCGSPPELNKIGVEGTIPMRWCYILTVSVAILALGSCSAATRSESVHRMGELTTVGPVVYNVLETEWRTELGASIDQRIPTHKFLMIRLSVTNSGNKDVAIPLLSLVDQEDNAHLEVSEIENLSGWLGLLRILEPAATINGRIVFDVPVGDYRLRVTDGGELESERTALVEIPLSFGSPNLIEGLEDTTMD